MLRRRRVPQYQFARMVEDRIGRGLMTEHRMGKLLAGRIKGVAVNEISHIAAALVELGETITPDEVREDLDAASRSHWQAVARPV